MQIYLGENRKVGALTHLERTEVGPAQKVGTAARAEGNGVERGHRARTVAHASQHERLTELAEHVAGVVGRAAVHTDGHLGSGALEIADPADAGAESHVGVGTMRDADATLAQPFHLCIRKMDTMGEPHPLKIPAALGKIFERAHTEFFH